MKNDDNSETTLLVLEQSSSPKLRRPKSRDVSSRFQAPTDHAGNQSPASRKPTKTRLETDSLRGLWPSSSSSSTAAAPTLGDHLGHERLGDILERNRIKNAAKENQRPAVIGGSMRFHGKSSSLASPNDYLLPKQSPRRASDNNFTGLREACTSAYLRSKKQYGRSASSTSSKDTGVEKSMPATIKRTNSLSSSSKTRWALSPGRSDSYSSHVSIVESKVAPASASFSGFKPSGSQSPRSSTTTTRRNSSGTTSSVDKIFDFFKSKKSFSNSGGNISEAGHEFRLLHNRLMQWRFANARAGLVNVNVANHVESNLVCGWAGLTKLQYSVVQKKIKLQKENLEMKLNFILQSQLKVLERWGDMEWQHLASLAMTKQSLHSAVCKIPLIEGAKIDIQSAGILTGRKASDLASSIETMLTTFSPQTEKNVGVISELAKVVSQEKLLLEECIELLGDISVLEIQERSLKCGITQMGFWQKHTTDLS